MTRKRFEATFWSREDRYSLGADLKLAGHYLAIPVSNRIVEYREFCALSPADYETFLVDRTAAARFAEECRARRHDDQLIYEPSENRGQPL